MDTIGSYIIAAIIEEENCRSLLGLLNASADGDYWFIVVQGT